MSISISLLFFVLYHLCQVSKFKNDSLPSDWRVDVNVFRNECCFKDFLGLFVNDAHFEFFTPLFKLASGFFTIFRLERCLFLNSSDLRQFILISINKICRPLRLLFCWFNELGMLMIIFFVLHRWINLKNLNF